MLDGTPSERDWGAVLAVRMGSAGWEVRRAGPGIGAARVVALASAPGPPPHPNFVQAMGRTNDAILFGGTVHLFVKGGDEAAENLANELPSSVSKDYGRPFANVFKDYGYDFFKVDAMLFSPAKVIVTNIDTGNSFHAGQLDEELLEKSFGG